MLTGLLALLLAGGLMADSLFGDLGLDEQTPNVLDFLGQEVPLAFRAEPALPTGGPVAGGAAPATIGGEGTVAAGEEGAAAAGGLLRRAGEGGDTSLQSILKGLETAGDPTLRDFISRLMASGSTPPLTMEQLFADFPQTIIGPTGLGPADIDLATAAEQGSAGSAGTFASLLPYAGAFASGALSGGDPTYAVLLSELGGMLNMVPGLGVAAGAGATLAEALDLNKVRPSAMQKKQMNTQFASDLGKQMIVDLQEATTPEELAQVLQSYSSGQYPVTFRSVLGGENVPTVDLDQILGPDFNIGVEGINLGDLGGQIGPSIANMVRYNAQLLKAAQAGDPEAVAQLAQRTAQNTRFRSGMAHAGGLGGGNLEREIYLNAIGDNAFPFTDRAGALQRIAEQGLPGPAARPAYDTLHAMGVPLGLLETPAYDLAYSALRSEGDSERGGRQLEAAYRQALRAIEAQRSGVPVEQSYVDLSTASA